MCFTKGILFFSSALLISVANSQSEYGENYEYYEENTDSEYYYGDYGDGESDLQEKTTTEEPYRSRTSYPVVQPYSNTPSYPNIRYPNTRYPNIGYPPPPIPTTVRPISLREPTSVNIRGYEDGWVEESGRRREQERTTTTKRPVYSPTYPPYRRTRRPDPTTRRPVSERSVEKSVESSGSSEYNPDSARGNEDNRSVGDEEEKGNLLHYLGYRKEDRSCPEGWVMDIYGYCRERFLMERRDWDWWWNIRDFYFGRMDSGYQSGYGK